MSVHARDELATRVPEPDVEAMSHVAAGVVENPDARVLAGQFLQRRSGGIGGPAIHEEEFDLAAEPLSPHCGDRLTDVIGLVQDRRQGADVDGAVR